jgi:hypothetical protein
LELLHHITVLEHDISAILLIPESVVILVIICTPGKWDDDFSFFEEVDLSQARRTATGDDEVSLGEDRSEGMSIDPVVEGDILESSKERSFFLIEYPEEDDPLDIDMTTGLSDRPEYIT